MCRALFTPDFRIPSSSYFEKRTHFLLLNPLITCQQAYVRDLCSRSTSELMSEAIYKLILTARPKRRPVCHLNRQKYGGLPPGFSRSGVACLGGASRCNTHRIQNEYLEFQPNKKPGYRRHRRCTEGFRQNAGIHPRDYAG